MDTCTYDVVGGAYEVMKKSTAGGVSGEVKTTASKTEADKFSHLSDCEAYVPASSSQDAEELESITYDTIKLHKSSVNMLTHRDALLLHDV